MNQINTAETCYETRHIYCSFNIFGEVDGSLL